MVIFIHGGGLRNKVEFLIDNSIISLDQFKHLSYIKSILRDKINKLK